MPLSLDLQSSKQAYSLPVYNFIQYLGAIHGTGLYRKQLRNVILIQSLRHTLQTKVPYYLQHTSRISMPSRRNETTNVEN